MSHMTTLFVFTGVMNMGNQSIQAIVTSFGPFCYRSCELIFLTIKYQVVQFLQNTSISEQFKNMYLTILQQILFLLLGSGGHRCME